MRVAMLALAVGAAVWPASSMAQADAAPAVPVATYTVLGDAIAASLTTKAGDAKRGRAIVVNRQHGFCLLCHSGPFPEEATPGNVSTSLAGAGSRLSEGQLRLRLVDSRRINPETLMPSYHVASRGERVPAALQGKPILTAQEVEDVVAFLVTLQ